MTDGNTMKNVIKTVFFLGLMALSGCAGQSQTAVPDMQVNFVPQKGDFLLQDGSRASLETVVDSLAGADYVIVGEGHTNACDHAVQQSLLTALSSNGRSMALGLEMVAVDKQHVLDDFAKGQVRPDELENELEWRKRWGYPFSLFLNHFKIAEKENIPVAGLNAPPDLIRRISSEGMETLSEAERAELPKRIIMPSEEERAMLMQVLAMHPGAEGSADAAADQKRVERFMLIQSIWESQMAEQAVALHETYGWPVMVVAGSGHVEYDWGIPDRIRMIDPDATVMTVMPWRGNKYDPEAGDFAFYCPNSYQSRLGAVLTAGVEGVYVEEVNRGSRADRVGLRPGMVIVEAQGIPVKQLFDIHRAGKKAHDTNAPLVFKTRLGCDAFTINVGPLGKGNGRENR